MTSYKFVIDTDHYAGNFERQMCAYLTGCVSECGVGGEEQAIFEAEVSENPLIVDGEIIVVQEPDKRGRYRPVETWPNPRWFNNGGGHFRCDEPDVESKALKEFQQRCVAEMEKRIERAEEWRTRDPALRKQYGWTDEGIERTVQYERWSIEKVNKLTECYHYPAYMSVAIHLCCRPTLEQIEFLKDRAHKFVLHYPKSKFGKYLNEQITIEGFRLIEVITTLREEIV